MNRPNSTSDAAVEWMPGQVSTRRRFVPNVPVVTHHGQRHLFYDDLVKDQTVIIHFFSMSYHPHYPVTRNLVTVQQLLGKRLGSGVMMLSITTEPERDDVSQLAEFAARHHARSGWIFITGERPDIDAIQQVFFHHPGSHIEHAHEHGPDCSMGLLRYGNDRAGLWGSVPAKTDPAQIVERLAWVDPPSTNADKPLKRRGPTSLAHP